MNESVVRQMITDDIEALLAVLPPRIRERLHAFEDCDQLVEVVMDLGRPPEARFPDRDVILSKREISPEDIDYVVTRIGEFGGDNRAGIERTLHRISAIRNRRGEIVGLTCRVGRAVFGTIDIIRDIVESGRNILLLGRPGVGKTTMLRETARVLGEKKRVIVVDTSNEIAGDGDIPHPGIGRARRMQVPRPELQHEVMIEAVENHMPEVIIIDEIGRELEAQAARTIAERGVQLVATAHGNTLDNLLMNPTLCDLVGGIQSVTLSDEEARRRRTQKTVLERKAPPTFDIVVEIQDRNTLVIHHDVAQAVDTLLRGYPLKAEVRRRAGEGKIETEEITIEPTTTLQQAGGLTRRRSEPVPAAGSPSSEPVAVQARRALGRQNTLRLFPYGLSQNRLKQAAKSLSLPVLIVNDIGEADMLMTLRSYYRKRPQLIADAERRGLPVYVLRSNTVTQMEQALADIFGLAVEADPYAQAIEEARQAIDRILSGQASSVELSPQSAYIRRLQHELARQANLISRSLGKEPRRRVRIYANDTL